tara:strand:+ start:413 stop:889 length:477 start_codon:yes stop_codon:yes gene_type:complete
MKKIIILFIFLFISNCSTNKVVNNHGTNSIDMLQKDLIINKTNKNDILEILGPPSTKSSFDENTWIYIEIKKTNSSIFKLGKRNLEKNNVLIVSLNNYGILNKKSFYDLNNMNDLDFSKEMTENNYDKNSFVYSLLTSLREKINSPVKKKQRSRINKN